MDVYNRRLLQVCAATDIDCLDLAAEIPKTTQYFWDDCHFTDLAQQRIAQLIAGFLERPVPDAEEESGPTLPTTPPPLNHAPETSD